MSMGSEMAADLARDLQKVLLAAVDTDGYLIFDFCKEYIYPLYNAALNECWDATVTKSDAHNRIELEFNFGGIKL